ncbi:MAG: hypothetical protein ABIB61_03740 [Candidatus Shapirobacteria bacterium]
MLSCLYQIKSPKVKVKESHKESLNLPQIPKNKKKKNKKKKRKKIKICHQKSGDILTIQNTKEIKESKDKNEKRIFLLITVII